MICELCREELLPVDVASGTLQAHRVCLLRAVMGGIGHLTNHDFWCVKMNDTDAGLTLYQSALAVDQWEVDHR